MFLLIREFLLIKIISFSDTFSWRQFVNSSSLCRIVDADCSGLLMIFIGLILKTTSLVCPNGLKSVVIYNEKKLIIRENMHIYLTPSLRRFLRFSHCRHSRRNKSRSSNLCRQQSPLFRADIVIKYLRRRRPDLSITSTCMQA